MNKGRFLARWSRLKRTAGAGAGDVPLPAGPAEALPVEAPAHAVPAAGPTDLPAPETLTLESDFTAFLKEEVGEALRRQALKKLFSDPHFNVMDGLDIYIDDYSVSEPIPPDVLAQLRHAREMLDEAVPVPAADEPPASDALAAVGAADDSDTLSAEPAATPPSADAEQAPSTDGTPAQTDTDDR